MFDKDDRKSFEYNEDLLANEFYGVKVDTSYINIVDEAISLMYMEVFDQHLVEFLSDGEWKEGMLVLPLQVYDEMGDYITDVKGLMDIPFVNENNIVEIVDNCIKRMMR